MRTTPKQLWRRLLADEEGTALTEFTIFLPVWIILFYGLLDMGFSNMEITQAQVATQVLLWNNTTALTEPCTIMPGFDVQSCTKDGRAAYMSARVAAPQILEHSRRERNKLNGRDTINKTEAAIHAGSVLFGGHWGESYGRTILLSPIAGDLDPKMTAAGVIGEDRLYPDLLVNDGLPLEAMVERFTNNEAEGAAKVTSLVAAGLLTALQAAGSFQAVTAGMRYGTISAETPEGFAWKYFIGGSTLRPQFAYDTLISPVPLITPGDGKALPFIMARMAAETETNYAVALMFGKKNWGGDQGFEFETGEDEAKDSDNHNEELDKRCEEDGFTDMQECRDCKTSKGEHAKPGECVTTEEP